MKTPKLTCVIIKFYFKLGTRPDCIAIRDGLVPFFMPFFSLFVVDKMKLGLFFSGEFVMMNYKMLAKDFSEAYPKNN